MNTGSLFQAVRDTASSHVLESKKVRKIVDTALIKSDVCLFATQLSVNFYY